MSRRLPSHISISRYPSISRISISNIPISGIPISTHIFSLSYILLISTYIFLSLCILFFPTSVSAFTISKSTGNTIGLVGWWTFDKMTTGQVTDWSGQGNHGQMVSMSTSTAYTLGKVGQALNFDGVDDYVDLGNASAVKVSLPVTVSLWVKLNIVTSEYFSMFASNDSSNVYRGYGVWLNDSQQPFITYGDGTGNISSDRRSKAGATSLTSGRWYHFVGVIRGATDMNIYINGVDDGGTYSGSGGSMVHNTDSAKIGATIQFLGDTFTPAIIDDVRIYNRALSASEVKALYAQGEGKVGASQNKGPRNGLIAHYSFDGKDVVGGTIRDVSGNGNHGQHQNISTSTFYALGKIGQGLNFDGSDDYVNLPKTLYSGLAQMTTTAWVYPTDTSSGPPTQEIIQQSGGGRDPIDLSWSGGGGSNDKKFFCNIDNGVSTSGAVGFSGVQKNANQWYFVVCRYDGVNVVVFINGEFYGSGAFTGSISSDTTNNLTISNSSSAWRGTIDDIRIYNTALSTSTIQALYAQGTPRINAATGKAAAGGGGLGSGLVGHWTFDGPSVVGGTIRDVSGNNNHGQHQNISTSTFYTLGKIGQALNFDGVDDYVKLPVISSIISEPETISAWIYPEGGGGVIFNVMDNDAYDTAATDRYSLYIASTTNQLSAQTQRGSGPASATYSTAITYGRWYHVVGVFAADNSRLLYVDGVQVASNSGTEAISSGTFFSIGAANDSGSPYYFFRGKIDDVRAYNRALSASEVNALYNAGR